MRKRSLFVVLTLLCMLTAIMACSSSSDKEETDSDGDQKTDGDSNQPPDGDQDGSNPPDGDRDLVDLPDCKPICDSYCDRLKLCRSNVTAEEWAECKESCEKIRDKGTYAKIISCGLYADCDDFMACYRTSGEDGFACDPGEPHAPDGDRNPDGDDDIDSNPDGDMDVDDTEIVDLPEGYCQSEVYCPQETHCDPETHFCVPACDPYAPNCPDDLVCRVLTRGELAGSGAATCVEAYEGAAVGESCGGDTACLPDLLCGNAGRCETICDPDARGECLEGLECKKSNTYGVGTCWYCSQDYDCSGNLRCVDGFCKLGAACTDSADCPAQEACFHGYCQPGCEQTGCDQGTCDTETGYCRANICENACENGECCNRDTCGPCCQESCAAPSVCDYDPECYPDSHCCVDRIDCREMPLGYCQGIPCDPLTGTCRGVCPLSCPWGYECGSWTDFECRPGPVESCEFGDTCSTACSLCDSNPFGGTSDQCVVTAQNMCGLACLDFGLACTATAGYLGCCPGMVCCPGSGKTVCCPQNHCQPGLGCDTDDPDGDEVEPYTCPECNDMVGTWCKNPEDTCPVEHETLIVQRDNYYPCWFILYHDSTSWQNLLEELGTCESQIINRHTQTGYDECILFWDEENSRFVSNCMGDSHCQAEYGTSFCSK